MKQQQRTEEREQAIKKAKADWTKADRAANPERYREIRRRYWAKRKAKLLDGREPAPVGRPRKNAPRDNIATPSTLTKWRDDNREHYRQYMREYMREYRKANKERIQKIYKQYCERQRQEQQ